MKRFLKLASAIFVALVLPMSLSAQSDNATVSGVVKDPSGGVIPGAKITLIDERTNLERRSTSNEVGYYIFTSIPPGDYAISVEAAGFKTTRRTGNRIVPSSAASIDLAMEVGGTTESVQVVASAGDVLPDSGTLGKEVDRKLVENTPLSGRNAMFLALLVPGVSGQALDTLNFGLTGAGYTSINGAPPQDSGITFDGANGYRTRGGGWMTTGAIDVDAVQEVMVLTSTYSAEHGRAASGQIRVITRGGGQQFHGSLFENLQNNAFNANSWSRNLNPNPQINSAPAPLHFNQFGYNINGPVYIPGKWNTDKKTLFFYFGQEFVRYRLPTQVSMIVPSDPMRRGDFGELLAADNLFIKNGAVVKDPLTGVPFPGNVIPSNRLSRNGLGLLKAYPAPQIWQSGTNWIKYGTSRQDQHKETYSLDYNPRDNHNIRFRGQMTTFQGVEPFSQGSDRTPLTNDFTPMSGSVNYTWTISPTMVNEFLVSAAKDRNVLTVDFSLADRSLYGIDFPFVYPGTKIYENKIPTITMESFSQLSGSKFPASSAGTTYRISNNLTKIYGNHTIKAGYLFEQTAQNDYDQITFGANIPGGTDNQNGRFTFTPLRGGAPTTSVAIANAAMGLFDTYAEIGTKAYTPFRAILSEWFIQDGWKVTPKLRLEFGLRHSYMPPTYSAWRNMILFDPAIYDPSKRVVQDPKTGYTLSGQDFNGMVIPGDGWPDAAKGRVPIADSGAYNYLFRGYPKGFANSHSIFQPRFGLAYQLTRGQVIRAGGGRFVQRSPISDGVFLGGQAPYQPQISVLNGNVDQPSGGNSTGVRFPTQGYTIDREYPPTEAYNWNVTYSTTVPWQSMFEISYVGRRSLRVLSWYNINQLANGATYANPGINPNYLRPYGGYYSIIKEDPSGTATYKGLQLTWNRRSSSGLNWGVSYTYSSSWDESSRTGAIFPNGYDRKANWALSNWHRPHILVVNYAYELPFLKNNQTWVGKVVGGWSVSGVSQFQGGAPISVATSDDFAGVGPGGGAQYWNVSGDPILPSGEQQFSNGNADKKYWFRTTNADGTPVFTAPPLGTWAPHYARNFVTGPGFQSWNIAGNKAFFITEQHRFNFRCEAFNFINHPNWGNPSTNPRAANFGMVQGKYSNRTLQLSLRYSF